MPVHSAGILPLRGTGAGTEVFLGRMGGPLWARKAEACWSVLKGEYLPGQESAERAARREFTEESGIVVTGELRELGSFRVTSGKVLTVFTWRPEQEVVFGASNTFQMEWPPRSGRRQDFPEIAEARWCSLDEARTLLVKGQRQVLDALSA